MFPRTAALSALQGWLSQHNFRGPSVGTSLSVTLLQAAPANIYRLVGYAATSTPGTGNVTTSVTFTDSVGNKTATFLNPLSFNAGEFSSSDKVIEVVAGSIIVSTAYTPSGLYNISLGVERLI